jgi:hypothetical protein
MLDDKGYRHTLGIFNIYCFSTATMVTRTRLNVTLDAHCQQAHTVGNLLTTCNRVSEGRWCGRNVSFLQQNPQFLRHGPNIPAVLNVKCETDGRMRDLRLSQRCCWECETAGMWRLVVLLSSRANKAVMFLLTVGNLWVPHLKTLASKFTSSQPTYL